MHEFSWDESYGARTWCRQDGFGIIWMVDDEEANKRGELYGESVGELLSELHNLFHVPLVLLKLKQSSKHREWFRNP